MTRYHLKIVIKMLLDCAVDENWCDDNPAERIKVSLPETTVRIWEPADVRSAAWASIMAGQSLVAAMILTQWEIGQRLTDVRLFRWNSEYQPGDGVFRFWQSKTNSYVTIPISDQLQGLLRTIRDDSSIYLFVDRKTGKPFAEQRLSHVWSAIREAAGFDGRLVIRALRHSCVVQMNRAGCEIPEIASITGHSIFSVAQILKKYAPRDNQVAWNAQTKRGLIAIGRTPPEPTGNGSLPVSLPNVARNA